MLATKFSGRWDESLDKDADGAFFIDQPAKLMILNLYPCAMTNMNFDYANALVMILQNA